MFKILGWAKEVPLSKGHIEKCEKSMPLIITAAKLVVILSV